MTLALFGFRTGVKNCVLRLWAVLGYGTGLRYWAHRPTHNWMQINSQRRRFAHTIVTGHYACCYWPYKVQLAACLLPWVGHQTSWCKAAAHDGPPACALNVSMSIAQVWWSKVAGGRHHRHATVSVTA
jgi:hypothetical protein